jgi:hypothetical protein
LRKIAGYTYAIPITIVASKFAFSTARVTLQQTFFSDVGGSNVLLGLDPK